MSDPSHVAATRRAGETVAIAAGFDDEDAGRVALVVTEAATNILKHAGKGDISVAAFDDADGTGVEVLALDRGPGIPDLERSLRDGHSTVGSQGTGLGAIKRLADRFSVWSRPTLGTAVLARLLPKGKPQGPHRRAEIGAVLSPYPGETVCGDSWDHVAEPADTLFVVDGSGHGVLASDAARVAVEAFRKHAGRACIDLAQAIHHALRPTRGASIGIARIDRRESLVRFVGVGNIAGAVISEKGLHRTVSHGGTAGHLASRIAEFTYPFVGRPTVLLHSDGIGTRWSLDAYTGLVGAHPSLLAGVLLRDFRRGRDDASVAVLRPPA